MPEAHCSWRWTTQAHLLGKDQADEPDQDVLAWERGGGQVFGLGLCFQQRIIFISECVTASTVCMLSKREQFTADPAPKRLVVFTWPKDAGRVACCVGCRCFGRPSCCHHRMPRMTTSKQQLHKLKEHWWLRAHAALPSRSQLPVAQQIEVRDEHPV